MSLIIAIAGAESTGKTTLAQLLAARLRVDTGLKVAAVPETLRAWCEREGRTPRQSEQSAIATHQDRAIEVAAQDHDVVVADTTSLMTAIYSQLIFGDPGLMPEAVQHQRRCAITLVTALDLPWEADGIQRDGAHVQGPVMAALREALMGHNLPWATVSGLGPARLESALDAVAPLLRALQAPKRGLFTRLANRNADASARAWFCERCDDPDCEHLVKPNRP